MVLIGVLLVILGLVLRLRPTLVVAIAGIVTGLIAGLPLFSAGDNLPHLLHPTESGHEGIINMLGRAFSENRLMTLFLITLPAVGLAERAGLQEQAAIFIRRVRAATVGRLQIIYQLFRVLIGILGIRLNGHPSFVRPLIYPMSLGAAGNASAASVETIKAANAAGENYGNFYGQNLSPVQPGVLLVYGVLRGLGYTVSVWSLVFYAVPIALCAVILGAVQFRLLDWRLRRAEMVLPLKETR